MPLVASTAPHAPASLAPPPQQSFDTHCSSLSPLPSLRALVEQEEAKSRVLQQQTGVLTVIVLEGFLLFFFPQVAAKCHHRIMLQCSERVSCRRRLQRSHGLQVDGASAAEFTEWYHDIVWKHFVKSVPPFRTSRATAPALIALPPALTALPPGRFVDVQRSNIALAGGGQTLNAEESEEHLVAQVMRQ